MRQGRNSELSSVKDAVRRVPEKVDFIARANAQYAMRRMPLDTVRVYMHATTRSGIIVSFAGACVRFVGCSLAVAFNVLQPIPADNVFTVDSGPTKDVENSLIFTTPHFEPHNTRHV
jgi:hypothetical protein